MDIHIPKPLYKAMPWASILAATLACILPSIYVKILVIPVLYIYGFRILWLRMQYAFHEDN